MNKENTQAFPHSDIVYHPGMTLRDYFAATALSGILHDMDLIIRELKLNEGNVFQWNSEAAYKWADAMMEARKK